MEMNRKRIWLLMTDTKAMHENTIVHFSEPNARQRNANCIARFFASVFRRLHCTFFPSPVDDSIFSSAWIFLNFVHSNSGPFYLVFCCTSHIAKHSKIMRSFHLFLIFRSLSVSLFRSFSLLCIWQLVGHNNNNSVFAPAKLRCDITLRLYNHHNHFALVNK